MNRMWYGLLKGRILKVALASTVAVCAFVVGTAPAWANAANPDPDTTATAVVNADGSVTVTMSGTWSWPGQACSGRYGEGWAVDWWGVSTSQTPSPSFSLTNATEVNPPGTTTTGTISPFGTVQINGQGGAPNKYFHVAQYYAGETINSSTTCTDTGQGGNDTSSGSWSAKATYPSKADIPPAICVNMYDEHGNEGQISGSSNDFSPSQDNDNSIQTNKFDPTMGMGYCTTPTFPPPKVYLGYADSYPPRIASPSFPNPWRGGQSVLDSSLPVLYVGCGSSGVDTCPTIPSTGGDWYDGGAIRIDNDTGQPITFTGTGSSITIGYCTYTPWNGLTATDQPGQTMILDQTGGAEPCGGQVFAHTGINVQPLNFPADENDDTSESYAQSANYLNYVQGGEPVCANDGLIPVVTLIINGQTSTITDNNQILNDGGVDRGGPICGVGFTANSTNTSDVLTNVQTSQGGTTGLQAGADITGAGFAAGFTVGEAILSVNPTADTITLSAPANATQVGLVEEELFSEANPWSNSGVVVTGPLAARDVARDSGARRTKSHAHRRSARTHRKVVKRVKKRHVRLRKSHGRFMAR